MTKFSAEVVLHVMIAAFLAGIALTAGVGYYAVQQAHEDAAQVLQTGREQQAQALRQAAAALPAGGADAAGAAPIAPALDRVAQQQARTLQARAADQSRTLAWTLGFLFVIGLALSWFFRYWIRRANVGPLRTALHMVQRVASGDLTASAEGMDQLHTRRLAQALDGMTAALRALVSDVSQGAHTVADTSAQIAQGNLDLSQRTE